MFDGNYRSRKSVDLSGKNTNNSKKRSTTTTPHQTTQQGKNWILEESRRQRLDRQQAARQWQAAVTLQRVVRGYKYRNRITTDLENYWQQQHVQQMEEERTSLVDYADTTAKIQTLVSILNFRLSLQFKTLPPKEEWFRALAVYIQHQGQRELFLSMIPPERTAAAAPMAHRIAQEALRILEEKVGVASSDEQGYNQLQQAMVVLHYCLTGCCLSRECFPSNQQLQSLSSRQFLTRLGGMTGSTALVRTLKVYLDRVTTPTRGHHVVAMAAQLWRYTREVMPNTASGQSLLGCLVFTWADHTNILEDASAKFIFQLDDIDHQVNVLYSQYFLPLATAMAQRSHHPPSPNLSTTTTTIADPLEDLCLTYFQERADAVIAHALVLYKQLPAGTQSPLLFHLLRLLMKVDSDLYEWVGLAVKGENVEEIARQGGTVQREATLAASTPSPDQDSDDDDEMDEGTRVHAPVADSSSFSSKKIRAGARLTKLDLRTVPQLDRLYQAEVISHRLDLLSTLRPGIGPEALAKAKLAAQIANPELWIQWGSSLLSSMESSENVREAQNAYVELLAMLLHATTGLKPNLSANSAFLTAFAFRPVILERLWRFILMEVNNNSEPSEYLYHAFSSFSDIFSHQLIALQDDQFLANHSTIQGPRVIVAEHVITHLRSLLYGVYWDNPVLASDVYLQKDITASDPSTALRSARARFLITGTKLWNSLYERWCRLLRHAPFCDEATWWFPNLTSLVGRRAVVDGTGQMAQDFDDEMLVDNHDEALDDSFPAASSAVDLENDALANSFSDPKMARILTIIPQALPFDKRVRLMDGLLANEKSRTQNEAAEMQQAMIMMMRGEEGRLSSRERVEIRRDKLYEDAMRQLNELGPKLKKKVQVSFINQLGTSEAGIDGGGVFKEFIDDLVKEAFALDNDENGAKYRCFAVTPQQMLAVNHALTPDAAVLSHYEFLGRVLGKAVFESILVEPQFCLPFLNQLLGKHNSLEDLKNYDLEYHRNLSKLLTLPADELNQLGLTFELDLPGPDGKSTRSVELVAGGRDLAVTKSNVIKYVHLVAHQLLNVQGAAQTRAFLRGFRDLIPASWVRLFSAYELQKLISGDDTVKGLDVESFRNAMKYSGGYHPSQSIIQWFWEILDEMSPEQQSKLLKFMTSCSRQPLLGFASLDPAPCIQQIRLTDELFAEPADVIAKHAPLPTSSTCMNLLKLPNYRSKELLRAKLLAAIESGSGFEMT